MSERKFAARFEGADNIGVRAAIRQRVGAFLRGAMPGLRTAGDAVRDLASSIVFDGRGRALLEAAARDYDEEYVFQKRVAGRPKV